MVSVWNGIYGSETEERTLGSIVKRSKYVHLCVCGYHTCVSFIADRYYSILLTRRIMCLSSRKLQTISRAAENVSKFCRGPTVSRSEAMINARL